MIRTKSFTATGLAPDGKLYAGDLNAIQDAAAAKTDLTQTVSVSTLVVGAADLQLLRYGAGTGGITSEGRLSGSLRIDGIMRPLGGLAFPAFTTTQRDAIASGGRPYGLALLNTTTNQVQWNKGTDVAPNWQPIGIDPTGNFTFTGGASTLAFNTQTALNYPITFNRTGDANYRFVLREDGMHEWGAGAGARDTFLSRAAVNTLNTPGYFQASASGAVLPVFTAPSIDVVGSGAFATKLAADASYRWVVFGDGKQAWGDGTNPRDTFTYRGAANQFKTDGQFVAGLGIYSQGGTGFSYNPASATGNVLTSQVSGAANSLFFIDVNGRHNWGAGGGIAVDTALARVGAGILRVENLLAVYTAIWAASVDSTPTLTNVGIGGVGPAGQVGLRIGSDIYLYKNAVGDLKTDGLFKAKAITISSVDGAAGSRAELGINNTTAAKTGTWVLGNDSIMRFEFTGLLGNIITIDSTGVAGFLTLKSSDGTTNMRVHRHPYNNFRHIESGVVAIGAAPNSVSVSYTDAFAVAPVPVANASAGTSLNGVITVTGQTTTGATFANSTWGTMAASNVNWHVEGQD